ncbi:hypothetical protein ACFFJI_05505 [Allobacillus sp. GCM10007491]|uniref:Uncharacterized protein n=1 Tax=Allobacillus saliphilus TaxID=2912308 RepID=A0A941HTR7_9BACI|nr:hypothetical protein [Allobacillus saliphilus]MBR7554212.1 hypothetical protein [Allobacillus saliphilus]
MWGVLNDFIGWLKRCVKRLERFVERLERFVGRLKRSVEWLERFVGRLERFVRRLDRFVGHGNTESRGSQHSIHYSQSRNLIKTIINFLQMNPFNQLVSSNKFKYRIAIKNKTINRQLCRFTI